MNNKSTVIRDYMFDTLKAHAQRADYEGTHIMLKALSQPSDKALLREAELEVKLVLSYNLISDMQANQRIQDGEIAKLDVLRKHLDN